MADTLKIDVSLRPTLGCDPEFFFKNKGGIIGAEKVLKKNGLYTYDAAQHSAVDSKIIIDGVQAELNPRPNTCREVLANEIRSCFKTLDIQLKAKAAEGISCDFSQNIEISKEELESLDKENQRFGCAPSKNTGKSKAPKLSLASVDATKHLKRCAGGHIHIGHNEIPQLKNLIMWNPEAMVDVLDVLVGNTCVLIDRDKGNVERRKLYGRAGEFRLPKHGLEYRTPSNFWLKSYQLMSLVFGLARTAVELIGHPTDGRKNYDLLMSLVDMKDIHKAINKNDYKLAMANFKKIDSAVFNAITLSDSHWPVRKQNLARFHQFLDNVYKHGLEFYFNEEPLNHWISNTNYSAGGFSDWLTNNVVVQKERVKEQQVS